MKRRDFLTNITAFSAGTLLFPKTLIGLLTSNGNETTKETNEPIDLSKHVKVDETVDKGCGEYSVSVTIQREELEKAGVHTIQFIPQTWIRYPWRNSDGVPTNMMIETIWNGDVGVHNVTSYNGDARAASSDVKCVNRSGYRKVGNVIMGGEGSVLPDKVTFDVVCSDNQHKDTPSGVGTIEELQKAYNEPRHSVQYKPYGVAFNSASDPHHHQFEESTMGGFDQCVIDERNEDVSENGNGSTEAEGINAPIQFSSDTAGNRFRISLSQEFLNNFDEDRLIMKYNIFAMNAQLVDDAGTTGELRSSLETQKGRTRTVDAARLPKGAYIVQVLLPDGKQTVTGVVVKQ